MSITYNESTKTFLLIFQKQFIEGVAMTGGK